VPAPEEELQGEERMVEAGGDTLGEARWNAMKALEPRFPGLTADCVTFETLEETPAVVRARVDTVAWRAAAEVLPEEPGERVRAVVARVVQALGLRASVDLEESVDEIRATVNGDDLGLLIGKHGSTIDALQHLAYRAAFHGRQERKQVVVDAAGAAALQRIADRAVADALSFDRPVELEPMRPAERKVVHTYLSERTEVETHSEGDEPERRLVVSPVRGIRGS
jgi:spoIIIJ-associated protein